MQLFEGKEKYLDLIKELRTVHALQSEEQAQQEVDKELVTTLKTQREQQSDQVKHTHTHMSTGTNVSHPTTPRMAFSLPAS